MFALVSIVVPAEAGIRRSTPRSALAASLRGIL